MGGSVVGRKEGRKGLRKSMKQQVATVQLRWPMARWETRGQGCQVPDHKTQDGVLKKLPGTMGQAEWVDIAE